MSASIPKPVLHYAFSLVAGGTDTSKAAEWREAGQYWIWAARMKPEEPALVVLEMTPKGVVEFKKQGTWMHHIRAGQPHHIAHLFGYWQVAQADRVWIQMGRPEANLYSMIWSAKEDYHKQDRVQWFCPQCGHLLRERLLGDANGELEGFVNGQLEAVRSFNLDRHSRTCGECGFLHPEAYGFDPFNDTADEKSARQLW